MKRLLSRRLVLVVALGLVATGCRGWGVVGDSVTHSARQELSARGAEVRSFGGVTIPQGRPAVRSLAGAGIEKVVVALGHVDVGLGVGDEELRRRVRKTMREDLRRVDCPIWVDLDETANYLLGYRPRAEAFNALLRPLAKRFGVRIATWSVKSTRHPGWFKADGIHLNARGQRGYAAWVKGRVTTFC